MAVGCYCPECGEYQGKDIECPKHIDCGNCEHKFHNERGEDYEDEDE